MATGYIWCTEGVDLMFNNIFGQSTVEDLEIFTFSNNFTPVVTCENDDLTEVEDNGLIVQNMTTANWVIEIDGADVTATYHSGTGIVWNATGDQNIYGIAIRGKTSNKIYYVKNFGLKQLISGNSFTLNPLVLKVTLS